MRVGDGARSADGGRAGLDRLIAERARRRPTAPAVLAPGRRALSYGALRRQVDEVRAALGALGLRPGDRVAVCLPEGPELAVAVLAVSASATCAPLDPALRAAELDARLKDLGAGALLAAPGCAAPALDAARARGLRVVELHPLPGEGAGRFALDVAGRGPRPKPRSARPGRPARPASPDAPALALHTSGTAARPKLVVLSQLNLGAAALAIGAAVKLSPADRSLCVMPLFHIHGLSTVFASLAAGGSVACTPGFAPGAFFDWLAELRPTWYSAAPTLHQLVLERALARPDAAARAGLRFLRSASAPMPRRVMADLERLFAAPFIEAYGMTEASPQIASNRLPPHERRPGSVGRAAGPEVAVMDGSGALLPPGASGEIAVRGANVARAYAAAPADGREAFVGGWFRTGDLGHLDRDGYLFVTGRLKDVINRGGEKISPREVDEVLLEHPAVAEAAAFAVPHPLLGENVAAVVVPRPGAAGLPAERLAQELREHVAARLAHYKVPQQVVLASELPLGPTGKLQRGTLAARLGLAGASVDAAGVDAAGVASRVADLWAEALGGVRPGPHDNFFALGGHSLAAAQVVARLRDEFQVELPMESLFARPTVAGWSELVAERRGSVPEAPARRAPGDEAPLSFGQQRLWFLDQLAPASAAYNVSACLRLHGPLAPRALERALDELRRRHEALRTTFRLEGEAPVQVVAPFAPSPLPVVDLSRRPARLRAAEVRRRAAEEASLPFDLARGPLFRASLLRLCAREHVLLLTLHHAVADGWSVSVLYRELGAGYRAALAGRPSPLPELPLQYADVAAWQRRRLQGPALEASLAYWRERLRGAPLALELPADRPRASVRACRGALHRSLCPRAPAERLGALGRAAGATPYVAALAAFAAVLARTAGQEDLVLGTPVAGRTHLQLEPLIGFFANTVALRLDLSGDPTFLELLPRVRAAAQGALAHQDAPFDKVVEAVCPERAPSRNPLVQVMFAYQNLPAAGAPPADGAPAPAAPVEESSPLPPFELAPGLTARPFKADAGAAKFDLTLYLSETERGLSCTWLYDRDLFEPATVKRLAGRFATLIEGVAADPARRLSELPLLSDDERHTVLVGFNPPKANRGRGRERMRDVPLHRLFEERVEETPEAEAVCGGAERLTYRELDRRANRLARHLLARGATPGGLVGLALRRSPELAVAALAVWKAGAAWVPLDPAYPAERLAFMLADARARVLVTEGELLTEGAPVVVRLDAEREAVAGQSARRPASRARGKDLAYVIYTSGSTGQPKGAMVTHANLCSYVRGLHRALCVEPRDRWLHTASFSFSSSVRQLAAPLTRGAAVVVASAGHVRSPRALFELVRDERVTVLDIVPSYWRACIHALEALPPAERAALLHNDLRLLLSASEPLPSDVPRDWAALAPRGPKLFNMCGQTETAGIVSVHPLPAPDQLEPGVVPVGRPIAGTRAYVLDAAQRPVPLGAVGELCVGGSTVGRGYLGQPGLTAERFVPDPFDAAPGARLYLTGDLARHRSDGTLEFLGRADAQIKVRGFRVEPREVEVAARLHPAVRDVAVLAHGDPVRLVAAVVPRERGSGPRGSQLRDHLRSKLPDYMVPTVYVELDELPLTPTGKLDRRALAAAVAAATPCCAPRPGRPLRARPASAGAAVPPRTPVEAALASVWQRVLGVEQVGVDDNFFELGGDSLLSVQVVSLANREGLALTLPLLFLHQTVAGQARAVTGAPAAAATAATAAPSTPSPPSTPAEAPAPEPAVLLDVDGLRAFGREALTRAGLAPEGAAVVTEVQLEASLRGQPTHNMGAIPRYATRLSAGVMNGRPDLRVEHETALSARLDGDNGPGQWVATVAMELALRKAREAGLGLVGVRRSNHLGAAGHYAWLAARQGLIGLCTSNGPAILAPTGGVTPTFGNNPLAVGIPAGRHRPILLDIAMSVAPRGRIGLHLAEGRPLQPGWILDRLGRPSTDPADLAAGLGVPIGGHKGYGLALVMEALAGALTGAGFALDHSRANLKHGAVPPDLGHFFMAIDPALLMPLEEFTARIDEMIEQARSGELAEGATELLVPGELELRCREASLRSGVAMRPSTYRALVSYARAAGLTPPPVVGGGPDRKAPVV